MYLENELIYIETQLNKNTPQYRPWAKYLFENKNTNDIYQLNVSNKTTIMLGDEEFLISTNFFNDKLFQQLINELFPNELFSNKKTTLHLVINSDENARNVGLIHYRFGYSVADMGHKYRLISKILCRLTMIEQELLMEFHISASPVLFEYTETPTENEKKEFNERFIFRIPFKLVPEIFNLNHKERSFFKNAQEDYTKLHSMEKLINKYGRKLYIFKDNENMHFLIDLTFQTICRIADGYKKILDYKLDKKNAPEYVEKIGRNHLIDLSSVKNILLNFRHKKPNQLPIQFAYEYNFVKTVYKIDITNIELSIKMKIILLTDEEEENFHIKIPYAYVPELLDMNQNELDFFEMYKKDSINCV